MNEKQKPVQIKYAMAAFLATVIFVITYKYTLIQLSIDEINDLREHTWIARDIYLDRIGNAWLRIPYFFWHLCVKGFVKFGKMPIEAASSCTCGVLAALNYLVTFFILEKIVKAIIQKDTGFVNAVIAAMLSLEMPLYMYWFNPNQYVGQFAINTIFNPTHSAVKPFGLLSFVLAVDIILLSKGKETIFCKGEKTKKWLYVLFSACLLLSTFTKPTFMYMLLPAGVIYLLIDLGAALYQKDGSWKKVWGLMYRMAAASIPSILYLLIEYAAFYLWGEKDFDSKVAIYPFLTTWHIFTPSVPKSILLAMGFPFFMVLTDIKYFIKSVEGRLSLIGYLVGTLEFSFFVETGSRMEHLNFAWPMMSGMLLLWVTGAAKLGERTCCAETNRKNNIIVIAGWLLLSIYMFSGLYYISPYQYII